MGCAGRGIIVALEKLKALQALEEESEQIVLYDVLGDVVCGGFAVPIREGFATDICIVSSGELMSLYAANNIAKEVARFASRGGVPYILPPLSCGLRGAMRWLEAIADGAGKSRWFCCCNRARFFAGAHRCSREPWGALCFVRVAALTERRDCLPIFLKPAARVCLRKYSPPCGRQERNGGARSQAR